MRGEAEDRETRAVRLIGVTFFALAAYLAVPGIRDLVTQARAGHSVPGLAVTSAALVIMPSLPIAKHRTGRALGNRAPIADAAESAFCAFIAAAALLGVGLNTWLGWWLADPAAAAAGIERSDPAAAGIVGGVLQTARHGRFLNTVVTTAPQVTAYLVEHSADMRPEPCVERLIVAALEVRATQPGTAQSRGVPAGSLTAAELRILKLLPTSTYLQIAATLFVSRNTVKAHLRSGLPEAGGGVALGSLERAVDLRLL